MSVLSGRLVRCGLAGPLVFVGIAVPAPAADSALASPPSPAERRAPARYGALTCTVTTTSGRPMTFSPPIRLRRQYVNTRARLVLRDCSSADPRRSRIASGVMTLTGNALANCTGVSDLRGRATVTWYDAYDRPLARSSLRTGTQGNRARADAQLNGRVTSGYLAGRTFYGSVRPRGRLTRCFTRQGIPSIHGTGRLTID
ncbi:hypothetical protein [Actinomadura miaoliensis]|uniref:Uncharacterized protein n=1 Tax=Actinomadura miaoliensis TaxID=430685 RepID=A0ABP7W0X8_9ACTN